MDPIKDSLSDMGKSFGPALKQQLVKELYSPNVAYKRSTLLHLCKVYTTPQKAVEAGFPMAAIKNAVNVLRLHGYTVDLGRSYISK